MRHDAPMPFGKFRVRPLPRIPRTAERKQPSPDPDHDTWMIPVLGMGEQRSRPTPQVDQAATFRTRARDGRPAFRDAPGGAHPAPVPVEPVVSLRPGAAAAGRLACGRRRRLQLQSDLCPGNDRGCVRSVTTTPLSVQGNSDLPRRFFKASAKPIRQAWQQAVGGDLSLPEIEGPPPPPIRLMNHYVDRILTAAEYDISVFEQFIRVAWLVDSPARMLRHDRAGDGGQASRTGRRTDSGAGLDVVLDVVADRAVQQLLRNAEHPADLAPRRPDRAGPSDRQSTTLFWSNVII